MNPDDLCDPTEITTWSDLPKHVYLCIRCGLEAVEYPAPEPVPVCLVKGGRKTRHGQDHPGPC